MVLSMVRVMLIVDGHGYGYGHGFGCDRGHGLGHDGQGHGHDSWHKLLHDLIMGKSRWNNFRIEMTLQQTLYLAHCT